MKRCRLPFANGFHTCWSNIERRASRAIDAYLRVLDSYCARYHIPGGAEVIRVWGVQIQADDILQLLWEPRIASEFEGPHLMRLHYIRAPSSRSYVDSFRFTAYHTDELKIAAV